MITVEQQITYMERLIAGYGENDAATAILSTLRQQSRLREALVELLEWAQQRGHKGWCGTQAPGSDDLCDCGYESALANGDAALSEVPQK